MQTFKLHDFLDRHGRTDDTKLWEILDFSPELGNGVWIAGGCIRRTISGQKLDSDVDFFFSSEAKFNETVEFFKKEHKEISNWRENEFNISFDVKFHIDHGEYTETYKIQLIKFAYYENVEKLFDSFDYTICMFGTDGKDLYCGDYSLYDLGLRRLVPHKITFPVASLRRLIKYTQQGYYICGGGLGDFIEKAVHIVNNSDGQNWKNVKYID